MPVYNAEHYVAAAVKSIQKQSLTKWELLIVDDGSRDKTRQILTKLARADQRIRVILNQKNVGMAKSLNRLLPLTKGTYIARMDADDVSLPQRLAKQVALLEKNPELVACGGHEYIINEKSQTLGVKQFPTDSQKCRQLQLLFMTIQPPVLMARGSVMRKLRYDTQGARNSDDISLYFKLLNYGEFSNVDEVIFKYRVLASSTTHANVKKSFWMAFGVRIEALKSRTYKPGLLWLLAFLAETVLVSLLPNGAVKALFELFRHRSNSNLHIAKA